MLHLTSPATKARPHYIVLDGLRGTAALCVVIFHFFEAIYPDHASSPLSHGYLAVDFFFCLSGFVIGYAYDNRLGKMSVGSFFKIRLIRLHPLVVLGSILGFLVYAVSLLKGSITGTGFSHLGVAFIFCVLLIPTTFFVPGRFGAVFPFNDPAWSLFLEYCANIFYILVLWKLKRKWLVVLTAIAAMLLCYTAFKMGTLEGGWKLNTFWVGGVRIFYSFLAGLLIHRFQLIIKNRGSYILFSVFLVLLFMIPFLSWNWLLEALIVICIMPFIIMLGSGAEVNGTLRKVCAFMGNISYPLYMTHSWFIWPFGTAYRKYHPTGWHSIVVIIVCTLFLVAFSYLVMRLYDEPVRARLKGEQRLPVIPAFAFAKKNRWTKGT
jgi:peptidoglycan/LPS O-acetylase OafA/YrhL